MNKKIDKYLNTYHDTLSSCSNPKEIQNKFLMNLIKFNVDCEYGRKHNFCNIKSVEDYKQNVPIIEYSDIEDMLYRQINDNTLHLLSIENIGYAFETSGTTGRPKIIPTTKNSIQRFDKYTVDYMNGMIIDKFGVDPFYKKTINLSTCPPLISKNKYHITDASMMRFLPFWENTVCIPKEACYGWDKLDNLYLQSRFALEYENPSIFYAVYINTFCSFIDYINNNYKMIIEDIRNGRINNSINMPNEYRNKYNRILIPNPKRADELEEIMSSGVENVDFSKVWPSLKLFVVSGSGSMKELTQSLINKHFGNISTYIRGIIASEGCLTVPIETDSFDCIPVLDANYYEFLEYEGQTDKIFLISELEVGKKYEMIITNYSGLYRYRTHDVFEIKGIYKKTPKLEFVARENVILNIYSEK